MRNPLKKDNVGTLYAGGDACIRRSGGPGFQLYGRNTIGNKITKDCRTSNNAN